MKLSKASECVYRREKPAHRLRGTICCALLAATLACAPAKQAPDGEGAGRVFSDDDRRAAQALSLSKSSVETAASPGDQARLCSLAIKSLADRFRTVGSPNPALIETLDRAEQIYSARAARSGDGAGGGQTGRDDAALEILADPADRARMALGCLQELA